MPDRSARRGRVVLDEGNHRRRVDHACRCSSTPWWIRQCCIRADPQTFTASVSAFKTSTGVEARLFMPVINVPFRLIFAYNPQRAGVPGQRPAAAGGISVQVRGRHDVLSMGLNFRRLPPRVHAAIQLPCCAPSSVLLVVGDCLRWRRRFRTGPADEHGNVTESSTDILTLNGAFRTHLHGRRRRWIRRC